MRGAKLFSENEKLFYSTQVLLEELGEKGQSKLKAAKVLCIGAGGLGSPTALYLSAMGVGHLTLLDNDSISTSNLHRQVLYKNGWTGEKKVDRAKQVLSELNPWIQIETQDIRLDATNADELIQGYDVVVDGSDNFATRYLVNDACVKSKTPLVSAAVRQWQGQLSVFNWRNGPCYRCLFPESSPTESCSAIGVLGAVPGVLGTLQAVEVVKLITGVGKTFTGRLLVVDCLDGAFRELEVVKQPNCACVTGVFPKIEGVSCETIKALSPKELKAKLDRQSDVLLVDVRTLEEHAEAHLPGDLSIPLSEFETATLPEAVKRARNVVLYCKSGKRSLTAHFLLKQRHGIQTEVLKGGIDAWRADGFKVGR